MAKQQEHERSIAALQHDESKKKLRKTLIALSVGALALIGGGGAWVYTNHQANLEKERLAEQARLELEEKNKKLEADRKAQDDKVNSLLGQLGSAQDEATKLKLQKELEAERAKQEALKKPGGGGGIRTGGSSGGSTKCTCSPGDPLCSCL